MANVIVMDGEMSTRIYENTVVFGDLAQAMDHFEDALTFCRKGYRPELAWTCHDYAEALFQRGVPGDREKAVSLLDEWLSISTEVGMRPLVERVAALKVSPG